MPLSEPYADSMVGLKNLNGMPVNSPLVAPPPQATLPPVTNHLPVINSALPANYAQYAPTVGVNMKFANINPDAMHLHGAFNPDTKALQTSNNTYNPNYTNVVNPVVPIATPAAVLPPIAANTIPTSTYSTLTYQQPQLQASQVGSLVYNPNADSMLQQHHQLVLDQSNIYRTTNQLYANPQLNMINEVIPVMNQSINDNQPQQQLISFD
jgi:hypothetical protein